MRNKPRIRFKGFTEDWEQRKLLDIAKTFIGLVTTMTENYRDSGTLLIRNSDIKEGQFVFSENPIHLDEEFAKKNKTRRLQIGDVVTVHTGNIGTSAVIEEKEAGAIGFATINTRTDKSILNPYFLATYFNTEKHKCYANSVSTGDGRSNYNIKDFNKLVISVPTLDEQERISVLINDMNTIITLHQRKLEKLKLAKKALLQKLFPKNGSQFPEIRFEGFTDAWEQRKLESLFTKYEDKVNTPSSGYWRLGLRSHCKGTFHTYIDAGNELETAEMNRVKSGNFILNITFAWERALAVTNDEDQDKLVSHRFPQFKPNNDLVIDFFKHTLMDKRFKHHLELSSPGGAGRNKVLKVADMLKYELLVPSIKEQNEISSFLNHVDYIITLHQCKLDKLQDVKKGLLQKMFV